MDGRLGSERRDVLGVIRDLERNVGGAREGLAEREVVVVLLELGDRSLVGLRVLARKWDEALAEPPRLGGGTRRLGPLFELRRAGRELD